MRKKVCFKYNPFELNQDPPNKVTDRTADFTTSYGEDISKSSCRLFDTRLQYLAVKMRTEVRMNRNTSRPRFNDNVF